MDFVVASVVAAIVDPIAAALAIGLFIAVERIREFQTAKILSPLLAIVVGGVMTALVIAAWPDSRPPGSLQLASTKSVGALLDIWIFVGIRGAIRGLRGKT